MSKEKFKILSIDGGGIKGVFPAYYLTLIEEELSKRSDGKSKIGDHFHLISGTSTGGIIALALSLGIPAKEIYNLYLNNAKNIFGNKRSFFGQIFKSAHERKFLEKLVRDKFKEYNNGQDPILNDCKPHVCIPIYDLIKGNPSVLKSPYHPNFTRDLHIPAYMAAMATSAAPTYFDPYSSEYKDMKGLVKNFANKVDGGVMANNPTVLAMIEATKAFHAKIEDLEILSIGTGYKKFTEGTSNKKTILRERVIWEIDKKWGLFYWMVKDKRKRLIELFMQSQSQLVNNFMSLLYQGIDKVESDNPNFVYDRVDVSLNEDNIIEMDESNSKKIKNFAELAMAEFHEYGSKVLKNHFY